MVFLPNNHKVDGLMSLCLLGGLPISPSIIRRERVGLVGNGLQSLKLGCKSYQRKASGRGGGGLKEAKRG